jgi:hypothetical protein
MPYEGQTKKENFSCDNCGGFGIGSASDCCCWSCNGTGYKIVKSIYRNGHWEELSSDPPDVDKNRGGMCFVTTIVCQQLGKPDNCLELEVLRNFRDDYVLNLTGGIYLFEEYRVKSDQIIKHILCKDAGSTNFSSGIFSGFISPIVDLIQRGENKKAMEKYIQMISFLENNF